ncbi:MAG TPA: hypothetical protein VL069_06775 [Opitutus sp.]|nr:hypothetical protein [Opitutus sp.]
MKIVLRELSGEPGRNDAIETTDYADGHGLFEGGTGVLIEVQLLLLMPLSGLICAICDEIRLD